MEAWTYLKRSNKIYDCKGTPFSLLGNIHPVWLEFG